MRFALAVLLVIFFGGLGVYARLHGREGLYWLCLAAAVISPYLCGMQIPGGPPSDGD
jgi:hypothetical protein